MLFNETVSRLFPCKDLLTLDLKYYEKNSLQRYGSFGFFTNNYGYKYHNYRYYFIQIDTNQSKNQANP